MNGIFSFYSGKPTLRNMCGQNRFSRLARYKNSVRGGNYLVVVCLGVALLIVGEPRALDK